VSGSVRGCAVAAAVAVCAVLAGPLASAQASNATLRATVNSYNSRIRHDEARVLDGLSAYKNHHPAPLIRAIRHEVRDLNALKRQLAGESGSTARGRAAKSDIIQGVGLIASAYVALERDVQAPSGFRPVSLAKVRAKVIRGRAKLLAGLKLLA